MTNYDNDYSNSLDPDEKKDLSLGKESNKPAPAYYPQQQQQPSPYGQPQQQSPYGQPQQAQQQPSPYGQPQQAQQQPSPYGQPQQQSPYGQPQQAQQGFGAYSIQPSTNKTSITAIILSGVGFFLGWLGGIGVVASIVGIVFGHKALREIRYSGEKGKGLAITALVLGYLTILFGIGLLSLFVLSGIFSSSSY